MLYLSLIMFLHNCLYRYATCTHYCAHVVFLIAVKLYHTLYIMLCIHVCMYIAWYNSFLIILMPSCTTKFHNTCTLFLSIISWQQKFAIHVCMYVYSIIYTVIAFSAFTCRSVCFVSGQWQWLHSLPRQQSGQCHVCSGGGERGSYMYVHVHVTYPRVHVHVCQFTLLVCGYNITCTCKQTHTQVHAHVRTHTHTHTHLCFYLGMWRYPYMTIQA